MLISSFTTGYTNTDAKLVCRRALRVERRDAHEPMHAALRPQKAVRVFALDLEHRALDPRLLALAQVEHVDAETLAAPPSACTCA